MKAHIKAGKAALAVTMAAAVTIATGTLFRSKADSSQVSGFTLPDITTLSSYNNGGTGAYDLNAAPGSDATSLGFTWITQNINATQLRYAPVSSLKADGSLPDSASAVTASKEKVTASQKIGQTGISLGTDVSGDDKGDDSGKSSGTYNEQLTGEYSNKVTLTGLKAGTKYAYQVSDGSGNWTTLYQISTLKTDSVAFAAFGDPQIGAFDNASGGSKSTVGHSTVADDESGWNKMLNLVSSENKFDFLFSLGDQVNDYNTLSNGTNDGQWYQYNYFFSPSGNTTFQTTPLAAFMGNHDHQMGKYYGYHYNQSNKSTLGSTQFSNDGDYWFTAGGVLFLVLNANNYGTAEHDQFIADAIKQNPNAKWKVASWHQSAYSEANHGTANDATDPVLTIRNTWTKMMDKYGIDVVLQGHDHYYTRTAQMLNGSPVDATTGKTITDTTWLNANATAATGATIGSTNANSTYASKDYPSTVTNPKGTVYFTLDSGSGSKYYNWNSKADHSFSVVGWQGYLPTYSDVSFTNNKFTINTYVLDTGYSNPKLLDSYTINKTTDGLLDDTASPAVTVGDGSTSTVTVNLNSSDITKVADTQNIAVKLPSASLNIPKAALETLLTANSASAVTVGNSDYALSSLPSLGTGYTAAAATAFTLTNPDTNKDFTVKEFGTNIQVTWTISKDKAASIGSNRQLFRVNDDGSTTKLDATYTANSDGTLTVTFETEHFSQFVVANVASTVSNASSTSSSGSGSSSTASNPKTGMGSVSDIAGVVAAAAMLGGASFVALRRKKHV